jgi:hypothetical protein
MNIFEKILDTNSMTRIDYLCEEQNLELNNPAAIALKKIYESNDLDQRHLIAHEWLGNFDEAKKLREWLLKKNKKL